MLDLADLKGTDDTVQQPKQDHIAKGVLLPVDDSDDADINGGSEIGDPDLILKRTHLPMPAHSWSYRDHGACIAAVAIAALLLLGCSSAIAGAYASSAWMQAPVYEQDKPPALAPQPPAQGEVAAVPGGSSSNVDLNAVKAAVKAVKVKLKQLSLTGQVEVILREAATVPAGSGSKVELVKAKNANGSHGCGVSLLESSTGAKQDIRRSLSRPSREVVPLPDGYCEAVYASVLGRATPDCATLSAREADDASIQNGRRRATDDKWWHRWGATPKAAVATLRAELTTEEKLGLVRGTGWSTWQTLPGFYVGSILAVPRLGIPSINAQDAGQGFRTTMAEQVGQALC